MGSTQKAQEEKAVPVVEIPKPAAPPPEFRAQPGATVSLQGTSSRADAALGSGVLARGSDVADQTRYAGAPAWLVAGLAPYMRHKDVAGHSLDPQVDKVISLAQESQRTGNQELLRQANQNLSTLHHVDSANEKAKSEGGRDGATIQTNLGNSLPFMDAGRADRTDATATSSIIYLDNRDSFTPAERREMLGNIGNLSNPAIKMSETEVRGTLATVQQTFEVANTRSVGEMNARANAMAQQLAQVMSVQAVMERFGTEGKALQDELKKMLDKISDPKVKDEEKAAEIAKMEEKVKDFITKALGDALESLGAPPELAAAMKAAGTMIKDARALMAQNKALSENMKERADRILDIGLTFLKHRDALKSPEGKEMLGNLSSIAKTLATTKVLTPQMKAELDQRVDGIKKSLQDISAGFERMRGTQIPRLEANIRALTEAISKETYKPLAEAMSKALASMQDMLKKLKDPAAAKQVTNEQIRNINEGVRYIQNILGKLASMGNKTPAEKKEREGAAGIFTNALNSTLKNSQSETSKVLRFIGEEYQRTKDAAYKAVLSGFSNGLSTGATKIEEVKREVVGRLFKEGAEVLSSISKAFKDSSLTEMIRGFLPASMKEKPEAADMDALSNARRALDIGKTLLGAGAKDKDPGVQGKVVGFIKGALSALRGGNGREASRLEQSARDYAEKPAERRAIESAGNEPKEQRRKADKRIDDLSNRMNRLGFFESPGKEADAAALRRRYSGAIERLNDPARVSEVSDLSITQLISDTDRFEMGSIQEALRKANAPPELVAAMGALQKLVGTEQGNMLFRLGELFLMNRDLLSGEDFKETVGNIIKLASLLSSDRLGLNEFRAQSPNFDSFIKAISSILAPMREQVEGVRLRRVSDLQKQEEALGAAIKSEPNEALKTRLIELQQRMGKIRASLENPATAGSVSEKEIGGVAQAFSYCQRIFSILGAPGRGRGGKKEAEAREKAAPLFANALGGIISDPGSEKTSILNLVAEEHVRTDDEPYRVKIAGISAGLSSGSMNLEEAKRQIAERLVSEGQKAAATLEAIDPEAAKALRGLIGPLSNPATATPDAFIRARSSISIATNTQAALAKVKDQEIIKGAMTIVRRALEALGIGENDAASVQESLITQFIKSPDRNSIETLSGNLRTKMRITAMHRLMHPVKEGQRALTLEEAAASVSKEDAASLVQAYTKERDGIRQDISKNARQDIFGVLGIPQDKRAEFEKRLDQMGQRIPGEAADETIRKAAIEIAGDEDGAKNLYAAFVQERRIEGDALGRTSERGARDASMYFQLGDAIPQMEHARSARSTGAVDAGLAAISDLRESIRKGEYINENRFRGIGGLSAILSGTGPQDPSVAKRLASIHEPKRAAAASEMYRTSVTEYGRKEGDFDLAGALINAAELMANASKEDAERAMGLFAALRDKKMTPEDFAAGISILSGKTRAIGEIGKLRLPPAEKKKAQEQMAQLHDFALTALAQGGKAQAQSSVQLATILSSSLRSRAAGGSLQIADDAAAFVQGGFIELKGLSAPGVEPQEAAKKMLALRAGMIGQSTRLAADAADKRLDAAERTNAREFEPERKRLASAEKRERDLAALDLKQAEAAEKRGDSAAADKCRKKAEEREKKADRYHNQAATADFTWFHDTAATARSLARVQFQRSEIWQEEALEAEAQGKMDIARDRRDKAIAAQESVNSVVAGVESFSTSVRKINTPWREEGREQLRAGLSIAIATWQGKRVDERGQPIEGLPTQLELSIQQRSASRSIAGGVQAVGEQQNLQRQRDSSAHEAKKRHDRNKVIRQDAPAELTQEQREAKKKGEAVPSNVKVKVRQKDGSVVERYAYDKAASEQAEKNEMGAIWSCDFGGASHWSGVSNSYMRAGDSVIFSAQKGGQFRNRAASLNSSGQDLWAKLHPEEAAKRAAAGSGPLFLEFDGPVPGKPYDPNANQFDDNAYIRQTFEAVDQIKAGGATGRNGMAALNLALTGKDGVYSAAARTDAYLRIGESRISEARLRFRGDVEDGGKVKPGAPKEGPRADAAASIAGERRRALGNGAIADEEIAGADMYKAAGDAAVADFNSYVDEETRERGAKKGTRMVLDAIAKADPTMIEGATAAFTRQGKKPSDSEMLAYIVEHYVDVAGVMGQLSSPDKDVTSWLNGVRSNVFQMNAEGFESGSKIRWDRSRSFADAQEQTLNHLVSLQLDIDTWRGTGASTDKIGLMNDAAYWGTMASAFAANSVEYLPDGRVIAHIPSGYNVHFDSGEYIHVDGSANLVGGYGAEYGAHHDGRYAGESVDVGQFVDMISKATAEHTAGIVLGATGFFDTDGVSRTQLFKHSYSDGRPRALGSDEQAYFNSALATRDTLLNVIGMTQGWEKDNKGRDVPYYYSVKITPPEGVSQEEADLRYHDIAMQGFNAVMGTNQQMFDLTVRNIDGYRMSRLSRVGSYAGGILEMGFAELPTSVINFIGNSSLRLNPAVALLDTLGIAKAPTIDISKYQDAAKKDAQKTFQRLEDTEKKGSGVQLSNIGYASTASLGPLGLPVGTLVKSGLERVGLTQEIFTQGITADEVFGAFNSQYNGYRSVSRNLYHGKIQPDEASRRLDALSARASGAATGGVAYAPGEIARSNLGTMIGAGEFQQSGYRQFETGKNFLLGMAVGGLPAVAYFGADAIAGSARQVQQAGGYEHISSSESKAFWKQFGMGDTWARRLDYLEFWGNIGMALMPVGMEGVTSSGLLSQGMQKGVGWFMIGAGTAQGSLGAAKMVELDSVHGGLRLREGVTMGEFALGGMVGGVFGNWIQMAGGRLVSRGGHGAPHEMTDAQTIRSFETSGGARFMNFLGEIGGHANHNEHVAMDAEWARTFRSLDGGTQHAIAMHQIETPHTLASGDLLGIAATHQAAKKTAANAFGKDNVDGYFRGDTENPIRVEAAAARRALVVARESSPAVEEGRKVFGAQDIAGYASGKESRIGALSESARKKAPASRTPEERTALATADAVDAGKKAGLVVSGGRLSLNPRQEAAQGIAQSPLSRHENLALKASDLAARAAAVKPGERVPADVEDITNEAWRIAIQRGGSAPEPRDYQDAALSHVTNLGFRVENLRVELSDRNSAAFREAKSIMDKAERDGVQKTVDDALNEMAKRESDRELSRPDVQRANVDDLGSTAVRLKDWLSGSAETPPAVGAIVDAALSRIANGEDARAVISQAAPKVAEAEGKRADAMRRRGERTKYEAEKRDRVRGREFTGSDGLYSFLNYEDHGTSHVPKGVTTITEPMVETTVKLILYAERIAIEGASAKDLGLSANDPAYLAAAGMAKDPAFLDAMDRPITVDTRKQVEIALRYLPGLPESIASVRTHDAPSGGLRDIAAGLRRQAEQRSKAPIPGAPEGTPAYSDAAFKAAQTRVRDRETANLRAAADLVDAEAGRRTEGAKAAIPSAIEGIRVRDTAGEEKPLTASDKKAVGERAALILKAYDEYAELRKKGPLSPQDEARFAPYRDAISAIERSHNSEEASGAAAAYALDGVRTDHINQATKDMGAKAYSRLTANEDFVQLPEEQKRPYTRQTLDLVAAYKEMLKLNPDERVIRSRVRNPADRQFLEGLVRQGGSVEDAASAIADHSYQKVKAMEERRAERQANIRFMGAVSDGVRERMPDAPAGPLIAALDRAQRLSAAFIELEKGGDAQAIQRKHGVSEGDITFLRERSGSDQKQVSRDIASLATGEKEAPRAVVEDTTVALQSARPEALLRTAHIEQSEEVILEGTTGLPIEIEPATQKPVLRLIPGGRAEESATPVVRREMPSEAKPSVPQTPAVEVKVPSEAIPESRRPTARAEMGNVPDEAVPNTPVVDRTIPQEARGSAKPSERAPLEAAHEVTGEEMARLSALGIEKAELSVVTEEGDIVAQDHPVYILTINKGGKPVDIVIPAEDAGHDIIRYVQNNIDQINEIAARTAGVEEAKPPSSTDRMKSEAQRRYTDAERTLLRELGHLEPEQIRRVSDSGFAKRANNEPVSALERAALEYLEIPRQYGAQKSGLSNPTTSEEIGAVFSDHRAPPDAKTRSVALENFSSLDSAGRERAIRAVEARTKPLENQLLDMEHEAEQLQAYSQSLAGKPDQVDNLNAALARYGDLSTRIIDAKHEVEYLQQQGSLLSELSSLSGNTGRGIETQYGPSRGFGQGDLPKIYREAPTLEEARRQVLGKVLGKDPATIPNDLVAPGVGDHQKGDALFGMLLSPESPLLTVLSEQFGGAVTSISATSGLVGAYRIKITDSTGRVRAVYAKRQSLEADKNGAALARDSGIAVPEVITSNGGRRLTFRTPNGEPKEYGLLVDMSDYKGTQTINGQTFNVSARKSAVSPIWDMGSNPELMGILVKDTDRFNAALWRTLTASYGIGLLDGHNGNLFALKLEIDPADQTPQKLHALGYEIRTDASGARSLLRTDERTPYHLELDADGKLSIFSIGRIDIDSASSYMTRSGENGPFDMSGMQAQFGGPAEVGRTIAGVADLLRLNKPGASSITPEQALRDSVEGTGGPVGSPMAAGVNGWNSDYGSRPEYRDGLRRGQQAQNGTEIGMGYDVSQASAAMVIQLRDSGVTYSGQYGFNGEYNTPVYGIDGRSRMRNSYELLEPYYLGSGLDAVSAGNLRNGWRDWVNATFPQRKELFIIETKQGESAEGSVNSFAYGGKTFAIYDSAERIPQGMTGRKTFNADNYDGRLRVDDGFRELSGLPLHEAGPSRIAKQVLENIHQEMNGVALVLARGTSLNLPDYSQTVPLPEPVTVPMGPGYKPSKPTMPFQTAPQAVGYPFVAEHQLGTYKGLGRFLFDTAQLPKSKQAGIIANLPVELREPVRKAVSNPALKSAKLREDGYLEFRKTRESEKKKAAVVAGEIRGLALAIGSALSDNVSEPVTQVRRPASVEPVTARRLRPETPEPVTQVRKPVLLEPITQVQRPAPVEPVTQVRRPASVEPATQVRRPASPDTARSEEPKTAQMRKVEPPPLVVKPPEYVSREGRTPEPPAMVTPPQEATVPARPGARIEPPAMVPKPPESAQKTPEPPQIVKPAEVNEQKTSAPKRPGTPSQSKPSERPATPAVSPELVGELRLHDERGRADFVRRLAERDGRALAQLDRLPISEEAKSAVRMKVESYSEKVERAVKSRDQNLLRQAPKDLEAAASSIESSLPRPEPAAVAVSVGEEVSKISRAIEILAGISEKAPSRGQLDEAYNTLSDLQVGDSHEIIGRYRFASREERDVIAQAVKEGKANDAFRRVAEMHESPTAEGLGSLFDHIREMKASGREGEKEAERRLIELGRVNPRVKRTIELLEYPQLHDRILGSWDSLSAARAEDDARQTAIEGHDNPASVAATNATALEGEGLRNMLSRRGGSAPSQKDIQDAHGVRPGTALDAAGVEAARARVFAAMGIEAKSTSGNAEIDSHSQTAYNLVFRADIEGNIRNIRSDDNRPLFPDASVKKVVDLGGGTGAFKVEFEIAGGERRFVIVKEVDGRADEFGASAARQVGLLPQTVLTGPRDGEVFSYDTGIGYEHPPGQTKQARQEFTIIRNMADYEGTQATVHIDGQDRTGPVLAVSVGRRSLLDALSEGPKEGENPAITLFRSMLADPAQRQKLFQRWADYQELSRLALLGDRALRNTAIVVIEVDGKPEMTFQPIDTDPVGFQMDAKLDPASRTITPFMQLFNTDFAQGSVGFANEVGKAAGSPSSGLNGISSGSLLTDMATTWNARKGTSDNPSGLPKGMAQKAEAVQRFFKDSSHAGTPIGMSTPNLRRHGGGIGEPIPPELVGRLGSPELVGTRDGRFILDSGLQSRMAGLGADVASDSGHQQFVETQVYHLEIEARMAESQARLRPPDPGSRGGGQQASARPKSKQEQQEKSPSARKAGETAPPLVVLAPMERGDIASAIADEFHGRTPSAKAKYTGVRAYVNEEGAVVAIRRSGGDPPAGADKNRFATVYIDNTDGTVKRVDSPPGIEIAIKPGDAVGKNLPPAAAIRDERTTPQRPIDAAAQKEPSEASKPAAQKSEPPAPKPEQKISSPEEQPRTMPARTPPAPIEPHVVEEAHAPAAPQAGPAVLPPNIQEGIAAFTERGYTVNTTKTGGHDKLFTLALDIHGVEIEFTFPRVMAPKIIADIVKSLPSVSSEKPKTSGDWINLLGAMTRVGSSADSFSPRSIELPGGASVEMQPGENHAKKAGRAIALLARSDVGIETLPLELQAPVRRVREAIKSEPGNVNEVTASAAADFSRSRYEQQLQAAGLNRDGTAQSGIQQGLAKHGARISGLIQEEDGSATVRVELTIMGSKVTIREPVGDIQSLEGRVARMNDEINKGKADPYSLETGIAGLVGTSGNRDIALLFNYENKRPEAQRFMLVLDILARSETPVNEMNKAYQDAVKWLRTKGYAGKTLDQKAELLMDAVSKYKGRRQDVVAKQAAAGGWQKKVQEGLAAASRASPETKETVDELSRRYPAFRAVVEDGPALQRLGNASPEELAVFSDTIARGGNRDEAFYNLAVGGREMPGPEGILKLMARLDQLESSGQAVERASRIADLQARKSNTAGVISEMLADPQRRAWFESRLAQANSSMAEGEALKSAKTFTPPEAIAQRETRALRGPDEPSSRGSDPIAQVARGRGASTEKEIDAFRTRMADAYENKMKEGGSVTDARLAALSEIGIDARTGDVADDLKAEIVENSFNAVASGNLEGRISGIDGLRGAKIIATDHMGAGTGAERVTLELPNGEKRRVFVKFVDGRSDSLGADACRELGFLTPVMHTTDAEGRPFSFEVPYKDEDTGTTLVDRKSFEILEDVHDMAGRVRTIMLPDGGMAEVVVKGVGILDKEVFQGDPSALSPAARTAYEDFMAEGASPEGRERTVRAHADYLERRHLSGIGDPYAKNTVGVSVERVIGRAKDGSPITDGNRIVTFQPIDFDPLLFGVGMGSEGKPDLEGYNMDFARANHEFVTSYSEKVGNDVADVMKKAIADRKAGVGGEAHERMLGQARNAHDRITDARNIGVPMGMSLDNPMIGGTTFNFGMFDVQSRTDSRSVADQQVLDGIRRALDLMRTPQSRNDYYEALPLGAVGF